MNLSKLNEYLYTPFYTDIVKEKAEEVKEHIEILKVTEDEANDMIFDEITDQLCRECEGQGIVYARVEVDNYDITVCPECWGNGIKLI